MVHLVGSTLVSRCTTDQEDQYQTDHKFHISPALRMETNKDVSNSPDDDQMPTIRQALRSTRAWCNCSTINLWPASP